MGLDSLLAALENRDSVTPVTSSEAAGVTAKAAPIKACTLVTPVTSEKTTTAIAKPETLQDRQQEARRQKVIAMLEAAPDTKRAIYADTDSDPHNVILAIAVRHIATCEMLIPKAKYDPWRLLELMSRIHGLQ